MESPSNLNHFLFDKGKDNKISFQFDNFPLSHLILDRDSIVLNLNAQCSELLGRETKEILGKKFEDFVHPDDGAKYNDAIKKLNDFYNQTLVELRIKKDENNYFHALLIINFETSNALNTKYYLLALVDFTSSKMKEEFAKDNEARFENMANSAPVMIWMADVDGLFSFVNKTWLNYTGTDIGLQLGMNWLKNVYPDDLEKMIEIYKQAIRTRKSFTNEFRFKNKNGNFEWMIINGTPRMNQENIFMGFIGSCTNINSQKEYEDKIKKVNEELIEVNKSKDKFFSIISHDLRNPLGAQMNLLDLIVEDNLVKEGGEELINEALNTSKQAFGLMENLLEWSRMQLGKISINPENINVLQLVEQSKSLYGQSLKNKNIELKIDVPQHMNITADSKMTETVLRNLIANAIKFTNLNGTIIVSSERKNNWVTVKVTDNGVGIPEEDIQKLFRIDSNYSTKGTAEETGTGLGLILCKELVEKQGGKINVLSQKGSGSTFYFTLPAAD